MAGKQKRGLDAAGLKTLCERWPGVTGDLKWGANLVFSVDGKMFAMTPSDGSEGGRLSFKVADDRFLELTDQPGFIPAPYLARAHWVSVIEPKRFGSEMLRDFVRDSYTVVRGKLTKKRQAELAPLPARKAGAG